jgi:hypothetical protein
MYRDWRSEKRQKTTLIEFKNLLQEKINSIKKVQSEAFGKSEEFDKLLETLIDNLEKLYKIHFSNYEFLLNLYKPIEPVKHWSDYQVQMESYQVQTEENIKKIKEYHQNTHKTYIQDDFINECYNVKPEDLK